MKPSKRIELRGPAGIKPFRMVLNVLRWHDGKEWNAMAMEMDLQGFGPTQEKAEENLLELVVMQMTFAMQKKDPRLALKHAAPHYWEILNKTREQQLARLMSGNEGDSEDAEYSLSSLPLDNALIEVGRARKSFARVHAS